MTRTHNSLTIRRRFHHEIIGLYLVTEKVERQNSVLACVVWHAKEDRLTSSFFANIASLLVGSSCKMSSFHFWDFSSVPWTRSFCLPVFLGDAIELEMKVVDGKFSFAMFLPVVPAE
eukprot:CAMPEP_0116851400 /NCGR_PEP_ID=MMETSP0418-20121206/16704_1 /TAXON_ID=1158023 /ORGANISM="Astrosyne radiata, Strain 13vi08-1A" /LENGTH=116 /DNA_ID=CAMNT_0004483423 /DNA_START=261 /DNA_END=611 /DNA_ORIENTATION=+